MAQLSIPRKLSYAAGGTAMNLSNLVISQWLFLLYAADREQALVPAALFGTLFMLGRITDAITDPLIGYWSDNARYRGGRRIPFIKWGLLPFAAVFWLLWTPPMAGQHWLNTVYVIALIQAYFVLYTVVNTPYISLLPEITSDRKERINISTLQAVFIMLGTIVFGAMGIVLKNWGWVAVGGVVAVVIVFSYAPTVLAIREKPLPPPSSEGPAGLLPWLTTTLKNRAFLHLAVATSLYWFGLNLMLMLVPFWVVDVLGLEKDAVAMLMAPFLGANIVFFFVFNLLAKRLGKYAVFLFTLFGSALVMPLLAGVGVLPLGSDSVQSMIVMGLAGIPVAGFLMLPFAILADVVDEDETQTGCRREAIYFGVQAIFQKSAIGLSVFVFGIFVGTGGADSSGGLRWIAGLAGLACAMGFVAFRGYPLRDSTGEPSAETAAAGPE